MNKELKMIIAGGKTGGHLFPGIAIAQAVLRLKRDVEILFVGIGEEFELRTLSRYGFAHQRISSAGIKGKGIVEKIKAIFKIPLSIIQAVLIIRNFRPDIVVGVGGFSSGAVVLGAKLCGVKTAIQEQNSIAGITNRILENFADIIFTSFKETKRLTKIDKMIHTGNPIRKESTNSLSSPTDSSNARDTNTRDADARDVEISETTQNKSNKFTILVTGGSQGAKSINSAFIDALQLMKCRENYRIIHQTGATDEERVLKEYEKMGVKVTPNSIFETNSSDLSADSFEVSASAFFNDLPTIQSISDIIICRAGAGTISEITAIGKPSILIPYPYAADDHQTYNAKELSEYGAAWLIPDNELSGEILKEKIEFTYNHPKELSKMGQKAKELGKPFADEMIASICIKMASDSIQAPNEIIQASNEIVKESSQIVQISGNTIQTKEDSIKILKE
ncbi:MAG: undecaprenyldiphospho-muramoylpentapeptide beta-N-acetylglucosaminyltransferase [Desulfamplus sp.]|nr:undecaprenyldiphospho-muramoylpentapeptide beta-N-acetylglucosaminyltransferase [Desulfamplus sp.]